MTAEPDGSTRITIRAMDIGAVVSFVLGLGEHVEILDPPEARAAIVAALDEWAA